MTNGRKDVHPSASRVSRCHSTERAVSPRWRAAALNDPVSATTRAYRRPSMLKRSGITPPHALRVPAEAVKLACGRGWGVRSGPRAGIDRRDACSYHGVDEEECMMHDLQGVADTLFIPLVARIHVSRRFPEYFYDEKALSLENFVPGDGIRRSSSEYMYLASVARYRNLDRIVREFAGRNGECNVVNLGAGLETAAFRLADCGARFYEIDLPEVIEAREKVIPKGPGEVLIGCDVLSLDWLPRIDSSIPTLFMASGVFQYFREGDVIGLARKLGESLPGSELVFDATDEVGMKYANRYVKKTGNTTAPMNFYINDPEAFARACGAELLEQRPFFKDMEPGVRRRLKIGSRIAMMVADRKRRTIIVHLKLLGRKS